MKTTVKKLTALLMSVLLLTLCGCKGGGSQSSETAPVADLEANEIKDVPLITMMIDSPLIPAVSVKEFLETVPGYGTEFMVEFELVNPCFMVTSGDDGKPDEDPATRLRRMRTEMMAGKGPDIFPCDCVSAALWEDEGEPYCEPIFNYPEQAMRGTLFLPLDEYIENAEQMEWDKLNQKIMEAGSYNGKQYLLPIRYQFNAACFDPEAVDEELVREYTALPTIEYTLNPAAKCTDMLSYFGQPADYDNDVPNFTEGELLSLALSGLDTAQKRRSGHYDDLLNAPNKAFLSGPVSEYLFNRASPRDLPAYTMLPILNRDGRLTASVTCYAAVNANADYPAQAFKVLDRLLSEEVQQNLYVTSSVSGVSVYDGLGTVDKPMCDFWMDEENYESYCALREQISDVKFYNMLDREAMFSISKAYLAEGATEDSVEAEVHKAYTTMKMMLAES